MSENDKKEIQHLRTIKSFVMRKGRLTKGQARALDELKEYQIEFRDAPLNLEEVFGNDYPVVVEIGFGMGDSLVEMANNAPETNFLGIEVHPPGVGNILNKMSENNLQNLKVIMHDAVDIIDLNLEDESISGFQVFFPDPWHKKRHHKRRLIQTELVEKLKRKLKIDGFIHCATDWEHYAFHMLETLSDIKGLSNKYENFAPRPESRPLTKFEKRGERLNHGVWDLIFLRTR